jgi:uncharacterized membrane protein YuzA (DUF378 family)
MHAKCKAGVLARLENLLLALWVGGLVAIGYISAPVLFINLDDRRMAGALAGEMFSIIGIAGAVIGVVLLLMYFLREQKQSLRQWRFYLLALMLSCVVAITFVVQPYMASLKAEGLVPGSDSAKQFGMMHGVSSILYMVTSIAGVVLLLVGLRRTEAHRAESAIGEPL